MENGFQGDAWDEAMHLIVGEISPQALAMAENILGGLSAAPKRIRSGSSLAVQQRLRRRVRASVHQCPHIVTALLPVFRKDVADGILRPTRPSETNYAPSGHRARRRRAVPRRMDET